MTSPWCWMTWPDTAMGTGSWCRGNISPMTRPRRLDRDAAVFGQIVNQLRLQRGWSLAHFARATGMNAVHLGVLERGENVPSLSTILRMASALGIAAAELVHRVELALHAARKKKAAPVAITYAIPGTDDGRSTD